MKHLLNCPVCGYTEISGNSCPNCDTDLSLIRLLTELPPSIPQVTQFEKPHLQPKVERVWGVVPQNSRAGWQVGVALLILMMGIGLGAVGSFLFLQPPQLLTNTVNSPTQAAIKGESETPSQPTQYKVKLGDHLTAITEQFCGKGKSWQVMVKANPQFKGRENYIYVGEVLKVPNCKEG